MVLNFRRTDGGVSRQAPEEGKINKIEKEVERATLESEQLTAEIAPLFHGRDPEVVASVISDLAATLLAGCHPTLRARMMDGMLILIRDLIPVIVENMIEQGIAPPDWREETKQ